MSRPKDIAIGCLALASSALAVLAWRQHVVLRQLAAASPLMNASVSSSVSFRTATQQGYTVVPQRTAIGEGRPSVALEAPIRDEGDGRLFAETRGSASRSPRRGGSIARLMDNPEFVQALQTQRHAMLDARFGALFRQLNLGAGELAAFKNLLAEKENVALEVVAVSESSADGPMRPEALRATVRTAQAQVEQAILNSLGSERYEIYRAYERTIAQRATVAQLEQRLSYTGTPLTPPQSEALVRILVSNAPAVAMKPAEAAPPVAVVVRNGVPEAIPVLPTTAATGRLSDEVIAQTQAVLAPAQVNALKELANEQQAALKTAEMIREVLPATTETPMWNLLLLQ